MSFPNSHMFDRVIVQPYLGESGRGPVYGSSYTVPCAIERINKSITDAKGAIVTANLSGVFRAECTIKPEDVVTYGNETFRAVMVEPVKLNGRVHHVEIDFVRVVV